MLDEQDNTSDLLEVNMTLVIDDIQYAVVHVTPTEQTFCKITKEFDGTMRLVDIVDDEEFERVQEAYLNVGAAN